MRMRLILLVALLVAGSLATVRAQQPDTKFSYVGTLTDTEAPVATGSYDLRARLYDAPTGGNAIGSQLELPATPVVAGQFAVDLDFGLDVLDAEAWLELDVRLAGSPVFETLAPRQRVGSVPLALWSQFGESALTVPRSGVTGVPPTLADGADADTLATLACGAGQLPAKGAGGAWQCVDAPVDGLAVLNGAGAPAAALGRVGEFYLDTEATRLYGPKTAAGWGAGVSLIGPPGSTEPPPVVDTPIGTMTLEPTGLTGAPTTFSLRSMSIGLSRNLASIGGNAGSPQAQELQVTIAADGFLPLLFDNLARGVTTSFQRARIELVAAGTTSAALFQFDDVRIASVQYEPSADPGYAPRVQLFLAYRKITVNGVVSYDVALNQVSGSGGCGSYLSTLAQGDPPPGFTGRRVVATSPLLQFRTISGSTVGATNYGLASIVLDAAGGTALDAHTTVQCAFAASVGSPMTNVTLSRYAAGAQDSNDWLDRITWPSAWSLLFQLQSGSIDSIIVQLGLEPRAIRVQTPTVSKCWDRVTDTAC